MNAELILENNKVSEKEKEKISLTVEEEALLEKKRKKELKKAKYYELNTPPKRTVLEEVGNSVTHGVGALFAIAVLTLLILKSDTPLKLAAAIVYGVSMFLMMMASCLYHAFGSKTKVKRLFRRFDYSGIYLLIGGTFAPLFLVYFGNTFGFTLFGIQWALIITGITLVAIFGPGRVRVMNFILFFAIGWSGIMFIPDFIQNNLPLLWWIVGGGVVYTLGMIPFAFKSVKGAHFIWHFFVLAGAVIQFVGILLCVY